MSVYRSVKTEDGSVVEALAIVPGNLSEVLSEAGFVRPYRPGRQSDLFNLLRLALQGNGWVLADPRWVTAARYRINKNGAFPRNARPRFRRTKVVEDGLRLYRLEG